MATVAEQLRTAREAQKLTVHQIADTTKIRTDHIRALEEGNFDVFVAPVYIKGFVRTYSTLLKLNVPQVMADLDAELRQTDKFAEPPRLSEQPRSPLDFITLQLSKVNWRIATLAAAVIAGIAVIIIIVLAVKRSKTHDPLKNLPPAVYHQPGVRSGDTLPLTNPPPRSPR
jgi:cytoskeleton protein RodZ